MKPIPFSLQKQFERYLNNNIIPGRSQGTYKKWLQYYLDFCHKYDFSPDHQQSLPQFIQKLQEKRQTKAQQELASKAITLYYQFVKLSTLPDETKAIQPENPKGYMSLEVDKPFTNSVTVSEPVHNKSGEPGFSRDLAQASRDRNFSPEVMPVAENFDLSNNILNSDSLKNKQKKGISWINTDFRAAIKLIKMDSHTQALTTKSLYIQ